MTHPFYKPLFIKTLVLSSLLLATSMIGTPAASAQNRGVPLEEFIAKSDKQRLDSQASDLYKKFDKVTQPMGDSVVYVCRNNRVIALGTVIAPGKVLTKWSDLAVTRGALIIAYKDQVYDTRVVGGDSKHDLVLLEAPSLKAPALDFSQQSKLEEGDFLFTVMPGGQAGDFGVVSVAARSLREEDLPYIGIIADIRYDSKEGTRVEAVDPRGAAGKAGIQSGDIIQKIDNQTLSGPLAIRTALKDKHPGDKIHVVIKRGNKVFETDIPLSGRPRSPQFSEQRLEAMNAVGNPMSPRRTDFPYVIQSDMTLTPSHAGAPVIDLNGKIVGLALSRAGRMETYILPASLIANTIAEGSISDKSTPAEAEVVTEGSGEDAALARQKAEQQKAEEYTKKLRAMQHGIRQAEVVE